MEILWKIIDSDSNPITGGAANTSLKLRRSADGFLYDWNDATFKASGWVTLADTMSEVDATNLPGLYSKTVDVTAFDDGFYTSFADYSGTTDYHAEQEIQLFDGVEIDLSIQNTVDAIGAGSGLYAITLQYYEDATVTPISGVESRIYTASNVLAASGTSDGSGQISFALNPATYTVRSRLNGYIFAIESITVSASGTEIIYGDVLSIPTPADPDLLTAYADVVGPDGTIPATIDASIKLVALPYYVAQFYTDMDIEPTYSAISGRATWTLPKGATIRIDFNDIGFRKSLWILPSDVDSVDLNDLTEA